MNLKTLALAASLSVLIAPAYSGLEGDTAEPPLSKTMKRKLARERRDIERRREEGALERKAVEDWVLGMRKRASLPGFAQPLDFSSIETYRDSLLGNVEAGYGVILTPHHRGVVQMVLPLGIMDQAMKVGGFPDDLLQLITGTSNALVQIGDETMGRLASTLGRDVMHENAPFFPFHDLGQFKIKWYNEMKPHWEAEEAEYAGAFRKFEAVCAKLGANADGIRRGSRIVQISALGDPRERVDDVMNTISLMSLASSLPADPSQRIALEKAAIDSLQVVPLDRIPMITQTRILQRFTFPAGHGG